MIVKNNYQKTLSMKNSIPHTVKLQDGTFCNFRKRIWKRAVPLRMFLLGITDPRKKRGIRHEVALILFIIFAAMTTGCTTIKDCHLWAIHNNVKYPINQTISLYSLETPF